MVSERSCVLRSGTVRFSGKHTKTNGTRYRTVCNLGSNGVNSVPKKVFCIILDGYRDDSWGRNNDFCCNFCISLVNISQTFFPVFISKLIQKLCANNVCGNPTQKFQKSPKNSPTPIFTIAQSPCWWLFSPPNTQYQSLLICRNCFWKKS